MFDESSAESYRGEDPRDLLGAGGLHPFRLRSRPPPRPRPYNPPAKAPPAARGVFVWGMVLVAAAWRTVSPAGVVIESTMEAGVASVNSDDDDGDGNDNDNGDVLSSLAAVASPAASPEETSRTGGEDGDWSRLFAVAVVIVAPSLLLTPVPKPRALLVAPPIAAPTRPPTFPGATRDDVNAASGFLALSTVSSASGSRWCVAAVPCSCAMIWRLALPTLVSSPFSCSTALASSGLRRDDETFVDSSWLLGPECAKNTAGDEYSKTPTVMKRILQPRSSEQLRQLSAAPTDKLSSAEDLVGNLLLSGI